MGYEISLCATFEGTPRPTRNPFTGKESMLAPLAMQPAEHAAVRALIARYGGSLDPDGRGSVRGHTSAIFFNGFDERGDTVKILGDLREACEALFALATAGGLYLRPDEGPVLATRPDIVERVALLAEGEMIERCVLVRSPDELHAHLVADWQQTMANVAYALHR